MKFNELLDNYPVPFFVIEPIYNEKGEMYNFKYRFINESFARFLGKEKNELLFNDFITVYGNNFEKEWMVFFDKVIKNKGFVAETRFSSVLSRTIVIESFFIKPGLCASFIRDYYANENVDGNRANKVVLNKANHDYMTNFYNENYLKEIRCLIEKSKNIGLIYADINDLRKINDEQGHRAGDQLILNFAKELRENFMGNDFFRLGGDEFLIVVMGPNEYRFNNHCLVVQKYFDETNIASLGYKYYDTIDDLNESIKEVFELMNAHKSLMRKKNGKK